MEARRDLALRAVVACSILSLAITVPIALAPGRDIVRLISPELLQTWQQIARWAWALTGALLVTLLLWRTRSWWWPLLTRMVSALRQRRQQQAPPPPRSEAPVPAGEPVPALAAPLELLGPPSRIEIRPCPEAAREVKAALIALGVPGCEVVQHYEGPVVKVVEIRPPEATRATMLRRLGEDLAARLGAQSVMLAPVVGSPGVMQVQIASDDKRPVVPFRALLDSPAFHRPAALPVIIGTDPLGRPIIGDLATMPHLLIAGTTGSGKSWFERQLLLSLLYRRSPAELHLVLIDPKMVELSLFEGLPHLLGPIITQPGPALAALQGLVAEMDRRYGLFRTAGVTNLQGYNQKTPEKLPYVVVVVDELADLMEAGDRDELESCIQRLGQKARAAGIHLVLATQRPSVDVITGTIKANIPARVSLRVVSLHDSRTIMDVGGAERLRDHGDFYFRPASDLIRGQAAAVPDELVSRVVAWWKRHGQAAAPSARSVPSDPAGAIASPSTHQHSNSHFPIHLASCSYVAVSPAAPRTDLDRVKELALEQGAVSRRLVAKTLGVGNTRAQELVEQLSSRGWLRPARGPHPRQVTFGATERRQMLASMRGVAPESVVLMDNLVEADEPLPDSHTPSQANQTPADLMLEAQRLDTAAQQAIRERDWETSSAIEQQLDRLIDLALEREDSGAFHQLAATRRWLKETAR